MLASKKWVLMTFLMMGAVSLTVAPELLGAPDIKEELMIHQMLDTNLDRVKVLYRHTHEMMREADPFLRPRHQARYRFCPDEKHGRLLMSLARKMHLDIQLFKGILGQAAMANRDLLLKQWQDSTDSLATYGKRALRARRDGNFALYLASAQAAEKELQNVDVSLRDLEEAINQSIREADARMEDL